mmetsp:Transcript_21767/g.45958  ORF Transcript_21767/g.45958 Transcript_21767/m.45958 type:complete len:265 (+) Transcript_21767:162-956(+)
MTNLRFAIALLLCIAPNGSSFQPSTVLSRSSTQTPNAARRLHLSTEGANEDVSDDNEISHRMPLASRRQIFELATKGALATSLMIGMPSASMAAVPSPTDLKRLQLGHSRVQYLLKNWDKLTEVCDNKAMSSTEAKQVVRTEGGGGGFCDKNPLVVQEYLGYKSTTDPLFKADSLMLKAVPLVDESVMDEADFVDLVEQYREKADQTALLAYTSSWGEANPNGGKEAVDDYLDKTKEVVQETEGLLRKVLNALQLEVLPPAKKA